MITADILNANPAHSLTRSGPLAYFRDGRKEREERASLLFADAWPSLFVGAKGTQSDVHVDSIGSHFWMALMEGFKEVRGPPHVATSWPTVCGFVPRS